MPPITIVFFVTGIAVWANAMYFLGIGAAPKEGGADPLKSVGWITLAAGVLDFFQAHAIISNQLAGDASILLSGLVAIYGAFFTYLGVTEIFGLDLRPLGNVWAVVFLAIAATTYGRFAAKSLGLLLVGTAVYTFWVPAIILALGNEIP